MIGTQDAMVFHLSVKMGEGKSFSLELEGLPEPSLPRSEADVLHCDDGGRMRMSSVGCLFPFRRTDEIRFFLGSALSSSQLIAVRKSFNVASAEVLQVQEHLGPCLDMLSADVEDTGSSQIIVATGVGVSGSLRCVRGALRLHPLHQLNIGGLLDVFAVPRGYTLFSKTFASLLFLTTAGGRTFLAQCRRETDDSVSEVKISSLDSSCFCSEEETLAASCHDDYVLQVLRDKVLLVRVDDDDTFTALTPFVPPGRVVMAAAFVKGVILALNGGRILPVFEQHSVLEPGQELDAGIEVHSMQVSGNILSIASFETNTVQLWQIPKFGKPWTMMVPPIKLDEVLPTRPPSLVSPLSPTGVRLETNLGCINGNNFLFVTSAEGLLYYTTVKKHGEKYEVGTFQKTPLGTTPVGISPVHLTKEKKGTTVVQSAILITGDIPTILFSESPGALAQCVVTSHESIRVVCGLQVDTDQFLLLWSGYEQRVNFSTIDMLQKLHMQTAVLGFTPDRIAYHSTTQSLMVCAIKESVPGDVAVSSVPSHSLLAMDFASRRLLATFPLTPPETPSAVLTVKIPVRDIATVGEGMTEVVVLGSTFTSRETDAPQRGKVRIFRFQNDIAAHFSLVHETELDGAVYSLTCDKSHRLLVGYGNKLRIMTLAGLETLVTSTCYTQVLCVEQEGDYIAVGDMLRSVGILRPVTRATTE